MLKKIWKIFIKHIDQNKLNATERILLQEEYKAERRIGYIRLFIYIFFLLETIIEYLFIPEELHQPLWPHLVAVGSSTGIMIELYYWGQERFAKYYNKLMKYVYISIDIILINIIIYMGTTEANWQAFSGISLEVTVSLVFAIFGAIFIGLSILRYSTISCIYTGTFFLISYFIQGHLTGFFIFPKDYYELGILTNRNIIGHLYSGNILFLTIIAAYVSYRFKKIVLRSRRQEELERFLPTFVAEDIINGEYELSAGGRRQKVTILFSDIRDFTGLSEKENPEEIINLLNTYLNDMIEIIFHYHGTLDKIMGDGIMAIYGAPVFEQDAPLNAIKSAIDMHRKLADFNQIREIGGKSPIKIGIGIHTGEVIMGNVGSAKRIEFTAIGDTVNTASRIENMTKQSNSPILISGETFSHLNGGVQEMEKENITFKNIGHVVLRGKQKQLELYEVNMA